MRNLDFGTLIAALAARRDCGGPGMAADDLGISIKRLHEACEAHGVDPHNPPSLREAKRALTKSFLEHLLRETKGVVSTAASFAGVTPQALHANLRRHDIDPDKFKPNDERRAMERHRRQVRINYSRARRFD